MNEQYKEFISGTDRSRITYHSSLMEIFKRFCYLPAPERGELKRHLFEELPPTQMTNETIDQYLTRMKITKSLKKYAKLP
jgi:hypothetical protein